LARRPAIPVDRGRITNSITTDRAQMRCECADCTGHRGRCTAQQTKSHPNRAGLVTHLAIVFRDYNEGNWLLANLRAMCQPCKQAHLLAKPKPVALLPEYGGGLFDAAPMQRRDTPTL
jgi:hypothetical protein